MKTLEKTTAADTTQRINISWELAEQCKAPAAAQGMSVRDYIRQTLHSAILHRLNPDEGNTKAVLPTENKTTATATMPSRKTKEVTIPIPRQHFEAFSVFANHFGLTPEMVMEHGIVSQLAALGDSALSSIAFFDTFPAVVDPVFVTLKFIPEAHALIVLVSSLLRRPLGKLAAELSHQDGLCYLGEMEDAAKNGGLDNHSELVCTARHVIESEFEARRGRMVKSSGGNDAWRWTQLESMRPSRLELSATA